MSEITTQIILKNDLSFNCISAISQRQFISGINRDSITFNFDGNEYSLDEIYDAFNNNANTSDIIIREMILENNEEKINDYHHLDYSILNNLSIKNEIISKETNDNPEVTKKIISITMGQKTYTEKNMDAKNDQIDTICEVIADMLGGAE